ncbi:MAG: restriction endonuclease [Flavobacterium sp.]|nr:restriction endonuclease [Flavobacterium sp.]
MEFLFSNLPPLKTKSESFSDKFDKLLYETEVINIATGFITADSLVELKKIVELNHKPRVNLLIGMHYFNGFTKKEYDASHYLNDYLLSQNLGSVFLSTAFKFHGKLYSFILNDTPFASIIGSNNLSSLTEWSRVYEASLLFYEKQKNAELLTFINKLISISKPLKECSITNFNTHNNLLENHDNVEKIDKPSRKTFQNCSDKFIIPLKAGESHTKSNLNVFFGEGRKDTRGLVKPRHWYEIELIIPKEITSNKHYPKANTSSSVFDVITDDGWKFKCKVSGDYSKNFRSNGDLKILGRWIKGRLENSGCLKVGELVTEEVLNKYGRSNFELIKGDCPNLWYLNFGV